jgi:hypothetical protein
MIDWVGVGNELPRQAYHLRRIYHHCFRCRMAFGLDFIRTDRPILTEKCDGSCVKPDWIRTGRPRHARCPVLMLMYAFADGSGRR